MKTFRNRQELAEHLNKRYMRKRLVDDGISQYWEEYDARDIADAERDDPWMWVFAIGVLVIFVSLIWYAGRP